MNNSPAARLGRAALQAYAEGITFQQAPMDTRAKPACPVVVVRIAQHFGRSRESG
jgi:hypothetical protein